MVSSAALPLLLAALPLRSLQYPVLGLRLATLRVSALGQVVRAADTGFVASLRHTGLTCNGFNVCNATTIPRMVTYTQELLNQARVSSHGLFYLRRS